jgi:surface polysaccharide O-acyltransferase-like enzyme
MLNRTQSVRIENIRVMAIVAVITIHVCAYAISTEIDNQGNVSTSWWIANLYESFCRFCVPVFVMVSGALLLPQKINLSAFLRKRMRRILLPFIFWEIIYLAYNLLLKIRDERNIVSHNWASWLYVQITQCPAPHLWYVYMIIGIYLFVPILQPWIQVASNKAILYFLGIWLIALALQQIHLLQANVPLDLRYFSGYIGYLILGYYIFERLEITLWVKITAFILLITGFAATLLGTYILTKANHKFANDFYNYLTVNVFALTIGLLILVKELNFTYANGVMIKIRNAVSKFSYGIYLSHPLIIVVMAHFKLNYKVVNPIIGIPLNTIICFTISCVLVYSLSKLPYGKYISG